MLVFTSFVLKMEHASSLYSLTYRVFFFLLQIIVELLLTGDMFIPYDC